MPHSGIVKGIRFNIVGATLAPDAVKNGAGRAALLDLGWAGAIWSHVCMGRSDLGALPPRLLCCRTRGQAHAVRARLHGPGHRL